MISVKSIGIIFYVLFVLGTEADIDVYFEDFNVDKADPRYIKDVIAFIDEDGSVENAVVANFTLIQAFPEGSEGHLLLMGASMGEYVLATPVDYTLPLCDMMTERTLIGPFLEALGFNEDDCPPQAGSYGTAGYVLPTEALTDDFPPNKYKATFEINHEAKTILSTVFFINVQ